MSKIVNGHTPTESRRRFSKTYRLGIMGGNALIHHYGHLQLRKPRTTICISMLLSYTAGRPAFKQDMRNGVGRSLLNDTSRHVG